MNKENKDFIIKTCEEIRLWKSKGLTSTESDILAYRLKIMKSPNFTLWNITNKKMAKLFGVSERTIERTWEAAIKAGLLTKDTDTGVGMMPTAVSGNADRDVTPPVTPVSPNPDTGVGSCRQGCRQEEPIFIGETVSLKEYKGNIKETSKGNIKEATKPVSMEGLINSMSEDSKETEDNIKSSNDTQNIKSQSNLEGKLDIILQGSKLSSYHKVNKIYEHNLKQDSVYAYSKGWWLGLSQSDYDKAAKSLQ